jgi:hypothetical protein
MEIRLAYRSLPRLSRRCRAGMSPPLQVYAGKKGATSDFEFLERNTHQARRRGFLNPCNFPPPLVLLQGFSHTLDGVDNMAAQLGHKERWGRIVPPKEYWRGSTWRLDSCNTTLRF